MEKAGSIWFSSEENKGVNILSLIGTLEGCRKVLEKSWGNKKRSRSNEKILLRREKRGCSNVRDVWFYAIMYMSA